MIQEFKFKQCAIRICDGTLIVGGRLSWTDCHYDVICKLDTETKILTVEGIKPKVDCMLSSEQLIDFDLVQPECIIEERTFWGKKYKTIDGWFEYKERKKVNYTSTNFTIIH